MNETPKVIFEQVAIRLSNSRVRHEPALRFRNPLNVDIRFELTFFERRQPKPGERPNAHFAPPMFAVLNPENLELVLKDGPRAMRTPGGHVGPVVGLTGRRPQVVVGPGCDVLIPEEHLDVVARYFCDQCRSIYSCTPWKNPERGHSYTLQGGDAPGLVRVLKEGERAADVSVPKSYGAVPAPNADDILTRAMRRVGG